MSAECQRLSQPQPSKARAELAEARAAKAIDQLKSDGWAVGPPVGRDEWRNAVRSAARAAGLHVRTGEASVVTGGASDGRPRPWVVTRQYYEALRILAGGVSWESVGVYAVSAEAERNRSALP